MTRSIIGSVPAPYDCWRVTRALIAPALLLGWAVTAPGLEAQTPYQADPATKFLGNVWSSAQLEGFTDYWDQVTPENGGKWAPLEPVRDELNWEPLDQAYALAKDNGFPFRFHTLVWGNQQPAWVRELPPEEQLEELTERYAQIAERYASLDYVEVVNEPMNDPPRERDENDTDSGNYYEALGGAGSTGWDWVLTAYRMAREYFPDSKLVINEYNVTNSEESTERYLDLVKLLQAEDLIDVVAVQGHAFSTTVDTAVTRRNLDRLASTGLALMITEFEIDGPTDEVQLADYQRIFPVLWEHPSVVGITFWGWRPGMWRTRQQAYLVREDGSARPALEWLTEYVAETRAGSR